MEAREEETRPARTIPEPLLILSDEPDRFSGLGRGTADGRPVYLWVADGTEVPQSSEPMRGDPIDPTTFSALATVNPVAVVDLADEERAERVAVAIRRAIPGAPVLLIARERGRRHSSTREGITWIDEGELLADAIDRTLKRVAARRRVAALRAAVGGGPRCNFLVQDDPDPDAIASALALRATLGYTREQGPIVSCGRVTRPENQRLIAQLGLRLPQVSRDEIGRLEPVVLVDVQPPYFGGGLGPVAAVVDHHPIASDYSARYVDVRPHFGASATMAAEYLLADGESRLTTALATALLYGIITDTRSLTRAASDDDLQMFAFLFPRADHDALRRIEHPSYSLPSLQRFGQALETVRVRDGLAYIHLGSLPTRQEHIVAQLADFCLGIEGAEISAVSGRFGSQLVMSTRAVAAEAQLGVRLQAAFGEYGSAGGHPVMAKAVIRLDDWRADHPFDGDEDLARTVLKALRAVLRREPAGDGARRAADGSGRATR